MDDSRSHVDRDMYMRYRGGGIGHLDSSSRAPNHPNTPVVTQSHTLDNISEEDEGLLSLPQGSGNPTDLMDSSDSSKGDGADDSDNWDDSSDESGSERGERENLSSESEYDSDFMFDL